MGPIFQGVDGVPFWQYLVGGVEWGVGIGRYGKMGEPLCECENLGWEGVERCPVHPGRR